MKKLLENKFFVRICILFLSLCCGGKSTVILAQKNTGIEIVVKGPKAEKANGMKLSAGKIIPLQDVAVKITLRQGGVEKLVKEDYTDENGRLRVTSSIPEGSIVSFQQINYQTKTVRIKPGQQKMEVVLELDEYGINESLLAPRKEIIAPKSLPAKQVGDTITFTLQGLLEEKDRFPRNARIVVMPYVLNLTRGTTTLLEPTVVDNTEFHASQNRDYGFDMKNQEPIARLMNEQSLNEPGSVIYQPDQVTVYSKSLLLKKQKEKEHKLKMATDPQYAQNYLRNQEYKRAQERNWKKNRQELKNQRFAVAKSDSASQKKSSFLRTAFTRLKKDSRKSYTSADYIDNSFSRLFPDNFWKIIERVGGNEEGSSMENPMSLREKPEDYKIYKVKLESGKDLAVVDAVWTIEDYKDILHRDTMQVSAGVRNVMRYLDYTFGKAPMITDSLFFPKKEEGQMSTDADPINLNFKKGESIVDLSDSLNYANFKKMIGEISSVLYNKSNIVNGWSVHGTASPEGGYDFNLKLAQKRLASLISKVRQEVPGLQGNPESSASVTPWDSIVPMLEKDGLKEMAQEMRKAVDKYKDISSEENRLRQQQNEIYKNEQLKELLETKYLPLLRTVKYEVNYSVYRANTFHEAYAEYKAATKPEDVSPYQYFILLTGDESNGIKLDSVLHLEVSRKAYEAYGKKKEVSHYFANALAADLINAGMSDPELLAPYVRPENIHVAKVGGGFVHKYSSVIARNHIVALLDNGKYSMLTDTASFKYIWNALQSKPVAEDADLVYAVAQALCGRQDEASLKLIAESSFRNELLVMLDKDDPAENKAAYEKAEPYIAAILGEKEESQTDLPDFTPMDYFVMAICSCRQKQDIETEQLLEKAFALDSSLWKKAFFDGDLYSFLMKQKEKIGGKINKEILYELEEEFDADKAAAFGLPTGVRYNKKKRTLEEDEELTDEKLERQLREATDNMSI